MLFILWWILESAAVQTGYKYALEYDYDVAVQFDGDGQHDINLSIC